MIFNLGKSSKANTEPTIEQKTISRWREASRESRARYTSVDNWSPQSLEKEATTSDTQTFDLSNEIIIENISSPPRNSEETTLDDISLEITANSETELETAHELKQVKRTPPCDPTVDVEVDLKHRFGANLRSAIGSGTVIEGKMVFESPVRVDGSIHGEVISSSTVIVGEDAIIRAKLQVGSLIVLGRVYGNVTAQDVIEIKSSGHLAGDIETHRFAIDHGGFFEGGCNTARPS